MKVLKKKYSTILSFLFLLLYIFANSSFILFHHHEASFSNNSVYIENHFEANQNEEIQQEDYRFSTSKIHCFFCDHHTFSFHQISSYNFKLICEENSYKTPTYYKNFTAFFLENSANKDPPITI